MTRLAPLAILASVLLGGCATTNSGGPVDVTRYHLGAPAAGSVSVEPMATNNAISLEYQGYADAVNGELTRLGFATGPAAAPTTYIAAMSLTRTSKGMVRKRPPVTIGIGGGTYGGNVGVGGDASFGIGGGHAELVDTELAVQLRRRSDNSVVWEGRAVTEGLIGSGKAEQPGFTAHKLAAALFKGFPGESGITITVK